MENTAEPNLTILGEVSHERAEAILNAIPLEDQFDGADPYAVPEPPQPDDDLGF